jgi:formylglycine-generating enzyme required for sulfatase activity
MVPVSTGLTFFVGDTAPCTGFDVLPYECGTQCSVTDKSGCVGISGLGPPTEVELEPFCIDEHEVTNLQYKFCEEMGKCPRRPFDNLTNRISDYGLSGQYDNYPANVISHEAAEAYCAFVGKRLPTAFEWERVAGGAATSPTLEDKRIYPSLPPGEADATLCTGQSIGINICRNAPLGTPLEVKTAQDDVVEEGGRRVYDLGGNFREWTSTPYSSELGINDMGLTCAADSRAVCNPKDVISAPQCGEGENPSNTQCCQCGEGGECFRICAGSDPELAICGRRFPEGAPVSQDDAGWAPPPTAFIDAHIVKGGSYDLDKSSFCQGRTSAWSFQSDVQQTQVSLGIRCAADAGTAVCPAP